jgi:small GTP-binding protein
MADFSVKIKELETELSTTKYNKRTQHHIGLVKAKIAHLKERDETQKKGVKKGEGYSVKKSGDATVVLIGFPSVGKSSLLNQLTNAESKVAEYDFTTLTVIPGLLEYNGAKIQILDIPGVIEGAAEGRGRGKEILSVVRSADMILILIDVLHPEQLAVIENEIYNMGIRMNKRRPDVKIEKTSRGGIMLNKTLRLTRLEDETVKGILNEFRIINASVAIREDIDEDQLIDVIQENVIYTPALIILNKVDLADNLRMQQLQKDIRPHLFISATKLTNLDKLKELIFRELRLIRIYCKQPGKEADLGIPLIMREGDDLKHVCDRLHRDFSKRFSFARLWGSVRYQGMRINRLDYQVKDKDIVELHLR